MLALWTTLRNLALTFPAISYAIIHCDIPPVALPYLKISQDLQQPSASASPQPPTDQDGTYLGVQLQVGTPPQNITFDFSTKHSDTTAASTRACTPQTDRSICAAGKFSLFAEKNSSTFREQGVFSSDVVGLAGLDITMDNYTFVLRTNAVTASNVLGLGSNSTILRKLKALKRIPSLSFGLGFETDEPIDGGTLVLGGYDPSRVGSRFFDTNISPTVPGLNIEVADLVVNLPNNTSLSLIDHPQKRFEASLDNTSDQLIFPAEIASAYTQITTSIEVNAAEFPSLVSDGVPKVIRHENEFKGTLTVKLTNGFEATIPSRVLTRLLADTGSKIRYISNVVSTLPPSRTGSLGAVFLSQTYLTVNYEEMKFSLATRAKNPVSKLNLTAIGCDSIYPSRGSLKSPDPLVLNTVPTVHAGHQEPSPPSRKNVVLAAALGGIFGMLAAVSLVIFVLNKRKAKKKPKEDFDLKCHSNASRCLGSETELKCHSKQDMNYHQVYVVSGGTNSQMTVTRQAITSPSPPLPQLHSPVRTATTLTTSTSAPTIATIATIAITATMSSPASPPVTWRTSTSSPSLPRGSYFTEELDLCQTRGVRSRVSYA